MSDEGISVKKMVLIAVFVVLGLFFLVGSPYTVESGQRGVLLTWGKASDTVVGEGLGFKIPIAQSVKKIDVRTHKYEANAQAASKDQQIVLTSIAVNYHTDPSAVVDIYRQLGSEYEDKIIQPVVQEAVKAATAKYTALNLTDMRAQVSLDVTETLKEKLEPRGIILELVSITNFDFSPEFDSAIEAKVVAGERKLTAERDLDRIKIEAQQSVVKAQAQADSELAIATAQANAKVLLAQSEAEALRLQKQQITSDLVQLRAIERWNGVLPATMMGDAVPFLNLGTKVTP